MKNMTVCNSRLKCFISFLGYGTRQQKTKDYDSMCQKHRPRHRSSDLYCLEDIGHWWRWPSHWFEQNSWNGCVIVPAMYLLSSKNMCIYIYTYIIWIVDKLLFSKCGQTMSNIFPYHVYSTSICDGFVVVDLNSSHNSLGGSPSKWLFGWCLLDPQELVICSKFRLALGAWWPGSMCNLEQTSCWNGLGELSSEMVKRLAVFEHGLQTGLDSQPRSFLMILNLFKPTEPTCTGRRDSLRMVNTQKQNKTRQDNEFRELRSTVATQNRLAAAAEVFFSLHQQIHILLHVKSIHFTIIKMIGISPLWGFFCSCLSWVAYSPSPLCPQRFHQSFPKAVVRMGGSTLFLLMGWISRS